MNKPGIIIYKNYRKQLDLLSDEQRGKLLMALLDHAEGKDVPVFDDGMMAMAYSFMAEQIDRDEDNYNNRCNVNRANGAKGGRPPKPNGSENNQSVSEKPNGFFENRKNPNRNRKEIEIEKEIENEINNISPLTPLKKGEEEKKTNVFKESAAGNTALWDALKDFQDMRTKMRKPMTDQAKTRLIHKLANLSTDPDEQIKILNQSTDHGWIDVYPLQQPGQQYRSYTEADRQQNTFAELDRLKNQFQKESEAK